MDSGRDRKRVFGGAQRKTADDGFARGAAGETSVSLRGRKRPLRRHSMESLHRRL